MSQYNINVIPTADDGTSLANQINTWRDAVHSAHRGPSRPTYAVAGTIWVNDSVSNSWRILIFNGVDDVPLSQYSGPVDAAGVQQVIAGKGVSVSPSNGVGIVTIDVTATIPFFNTNGAERPIPLKA
jgi:hypothetical protein